MTDDIKLKGEGTKVFFYTYVHAGKHRCKGTCVQIGRHRHSRTHL